MKPCMSTIKTAQQRFRERHPERGREAQRRFRQRHLERIRTENRIRQLKRHREARINLIEILGGKCLRCGFDDHRALQFDHINGDAWRYRHHKHGTTRAQQEAVVLLRDGEDSLKERFQLLCANCNWIKRFENGEHRR